MTENNSGQEIFEILIKIGIMSYLIQQIIFIKFLVYKMLFQIRDFNKKHKGVTKTAVGMHFDNYAS